MNPHDIHDTLDALYQGTPPCPQCGGELIRRTVHPCLSDCADMLVEFCMDCPDYLAFPLREKDTDNG